MFVKRRYCNWNSRSEPRSAKSGQTMVTGDHVPRSCCNTYVVCSATLLSEAATITATRYSATITATRYSATATLSGKTKRTIPILTDVSHQFLQF